MAARNNSPDRLIMAVRQGRENIVKQLLAAGVSPNITDNNGISLLSQAAWNNDLPMLLLLIENGADVRNDTNAIEYAIRKNNAKTVNYLISKGAKISEDLLKYAYENRFDGAADVILQHLYREKVSSDISEFIAFMRKYPGLRTNWQDSNGRTILRSSCTAAGNPEVTKFLLQKFADIDVNIPDNKGITPLHAFITNKVDDEGDSFSYQDILDVFLQKGANIRAITNEGNTVFHHAAAGRSGNVIPYLIQQYVKRVGKDPLLTYKNRDGEVPIQVTYRGIDGFVRDTNKEGFMTLWGYMVDFPGNTLEYKVTGANFIQQDLALLSQNDSNIDIVDFESFFTTYAVGPICKEVEFAGNAYIDSMRQQVNYSQMANHGLSIGEAEARRRYPAGSGPLAEVFYECFKKGADFFYNVGGGAKRKVRKGKTKKVRKMKH